MTSSETISPEPTPQAAPSPSQPASPQPDRTRRWALIAVVVVAVALVLWLTLRGGDDVDVSKEAAVGAVIVEPDDLSDVAKRRGHPIYWAGERPDVKYELTELESGRVFVRYLTGDAEAGDGGAGFLVVGTYPVGDGVAALRRAAKGDPSSEEGKSAKGVSVLVNPDRANNVHMAFPGAAEQIEVYSPDTEEALDLAINDKIQPVP